MAVPNTTEAVKHGAFFSPEEWLALFAAPPAPAPRDCPPWLAELAALDPAADLRRERPIDANSILDAVKDVPAMRRALALHLGTVNYVSKMVLSRILWDSSQMFLFLLVWAWNGGRFPLRSMIAASVAIVTQSAVWTASVFLLAMAAALRPTGVQDDNGVIAGPETASLDSHTMAGFVRWHQLVSLFNRTGEGAGVNKEEGYERYAGQSRLLEHDDKDGLCPCPSSKCGGRFLYESFLYSVIFLTYVIVGTAFSSFILFAWSSSSLLANSPGVHHGLRC